MFRTVLLTTGIWFGVALVVGLIVGRFLRQRTAPPKAGERSQYRNSA